MKKKNNYSVQLKTETQAADHSEQMRGNQFTEEIITLLLYGKINHNNRSTYRCLLWSLLQLRLQMCVVARMLSEWMVTSGACVCDWCLDRFRVSMKNKKSSHLQVHCQRISVTGHRTEHLFYIYTNLPNFSSYIPSVCLTFTAKYWLCCMWVCYTRSDFVYKTILVLSA